MAIFGLKMAKKWPFGVKNYFFCKSKVASMLKKYPVIWDGLILLKKLTASRFFWLLPENGHFRAKNGQKMAF